MSFYWQCSINSQCHWSAENVTGQWVAQLIHWCVVHCMHDVFAQSCGSGKCAAHTDDRRIYKVKTVGLNWNIGNSMHYMTVQSCGSGKHEQHILRTERRVKISGLKRNKKSLVSTAFIVHWCSMICFAVTASVFDATVSQIRSWVSVLLKWLPLSSHHPVTNPLFYHCSVSDSKYRYSQDIDSWLESEVGAFAKISTLF